METDRRVSIRTTLADIYLPYYDKLCSILSPNWVPYSGFRTFYNQDQLYAQGRTLPGSIVTNAKGGESAHNYGCATDWIWIENGSIIWLEDSDSRWQHYLDAIMSAGLYAGNNFGDIDHSELHISVPWGDIFPVYNASGMDQAMVKIKASII